MKDVTSTSFGLLIAYVLPGMVGFYSLKYYSCNVKIIFETFLTANSNVGLFFMVILAALVIGLTVTTYRWLIYECIFCRSQRLKAADFAAIGDNENKLIAFRADTDELYRYHQFWGGMTLVFPLFIVGLLIENVNSMSKSIFILCCIGSFATEIIIGKAAIEAYNRYVIRAKAIMGGE